jgi:hypothetical protein
MSVKIKKTTVYTLCLPMQAVDKCNVCGATLFCNHHNELILAISKDVAKTAHICNRTINDPSITHQYYASTKIFTIFNIQTFF